MLTKELESNVLALKAIEKIHLVEILLNSLDRPNKEIEKKWVDESEKRYDAYKSGKLKGIPIEKIKAKYEESKLYLLNLQIKNWMMELNIMKIKFLV